MVPCEPNYLVHEFSEGASTIGENKMNFEKDEIELPLYNLMLEVTRKCNLKCKHCMRGAAQHLNMSAEVLEVVFRQIKYIYHLSLTGGEPFLAPEVVEKMVDIIIEKKIKVYRCTTVDNGTILNELGVRSVKALNRLGEYIYNSVWDSDKKDENNNPPISISISNSKYHKNDIQKAIEFYKGYANKYVNVDDQGEWESGLKDKQGNVIRNKDMKGNDSNWLKKEGRAKENGLPCKYMTDAYNIEFFTTDDGKKTIVKTGIQICANGNVVPPEALSFESMDKKNMGNILKEPLSAMIYKWNWEEPLKYEEVKEYCNNMSLMENPHLSDKKRMELNFRNNYLDTKKMLHREIHKDYPYMTKDDVSIAAIAKLALITLQNSECLISEELTEEDIIRIVLQYELTGDGELGKITKKDLEQMLLYMIDNHNKEVIKHRGFTGYIKYISDIMSKQKSGYYDKLNVSAYNK